MKKILLIVAIAIATYSFSNAQELGVRFGDVSGGSVAIDGIFAAGQFSRLHGDISFGDGVGIDVLWDFLYRPLGDEAFYWYVGAGPYMVIDDPFWLGVAGEVGLEYRFEAVPIALGLDWRPELSIIEKTSFHAGGFGFNVRYIFGD
ncbi:hypothetical protein N9164_06115 [Draconibacterium sp.]|nr:hypothetical protein [Draconibacterium sp.]